MMTHCRTMSTASSGIGSTALVPTRNVLGDLPRPVAVVLSGGGALGAAHVGVGYALEQRGLDPDLIVGTSVGALTGAVAAAHPRGGARRLEALWSGLTRRDVFPVGYRPGRVSICTDRGLRRLIRSAALPERIEDLPAPFIAVATDLATGEAVPMDHGDLTSALLASTAIPGILPPVVRDGRTLVDGGVVSCVPVGTAHQAGAATILVLTARVSSLSEDLPGFGATAVAIRARRLQIREQLRRDLRRTAADIPVVVVPTGVQAWPAAWSFNHSQRLIRTAYAASGQFLDQLRIDGPGLYGGAA